MHTSRPRDDKGAIVVLMAISMTALLLVAGLVMDGGAAYAQRRQMQNAADASAMAGAAALDDVRFGGAAVGTVQSRAQQIAQRNGAESAVCQIVDGTGAVVGPCTTAGAVLAPEARGVKVTPADVRNTMLGAFVGMKTVTARADATATIQPVVGAKAPYAVCSSGATGKYDILTDGKIDTAKAAAAGLIDLVGAQVYKDDLGCTASGGPGAGSFKGKIDETLQVTVGSTIAFNDPGVGNPEYSAFRMQCPVAPTTNDCLLLPVADHVTQGGDAEVRIVAWAIWRVQETGCGATSAGVVKLCGRFVQPVGAGPVPPGGVTGNGEPTSGGPRSIGLVE